MSAWRSLPTPAEPQASTPPDGGKSAEAVLVGRAAVDSDAFASLYRQHVDAVARYIGRRVGDATLTEDLVSETFVPALKNIGRYRHRGLPFRAWLYRLATTSVSRWARSEGRMVVRSLEAELPLAEPSSDDDRRQVAQAALLALPTRYQEVLVLHSMEGLPVREVATIVGCREGTVKSRLSRARDAMKQELARRRWS